MTSSSSRLGFLGAKLDNSIIILYYEIMYLLPVLLSCILPTIRVEYFCWCDQIIYLMKYITSFLPNDQKFYTILVCCLLFLVKFENHAPPPRAVVVVHVLSELLGQHIRGAVKTRALP